MKHPAHMESATDIQVVSSFQLDDSRELLFYSHTFRGRRRGVIRIFVESPKYAGPTKAGIDMSLHQLKQLHETLQPLPNDLDSALIVPPLEIGQIPGDTGSSQWVIQILEQERDPTQYLLDVRKYVKSKKYTGWTKKGLRVDVDLIDEIINHLPLLIEALEDWEAGRTGLFSEDLQRKETKDHRQSPQEEAGLDSVPEDLKDYF